MVVRRFTKEAGWQGGVRVAFNGESDIGSFLKMLNHLIIGMAPHVWPLGKQGENISKKIDCCSKI